MKCQQGFAVLDKAKHLELSRKGGLTSAASGKGHKYQAGSQLAKESGKKGAAVARANRAARADTIPVPPMFPTV
jgi:general stress protein YciG